jgi:hypothetical protein
LDRSIGLGLSNGIAPLDAMPGWGQHLWWGYHGDDGGAFDSDSHSVEYETYCKGDIVGCGVDQQGRLYFTKNGKYQGKRSFNVLVQ